MKSRGFLSGSIEEGGDLAWKNSSTKGTRRLLSLAFLLPQILCILRANEGSRGGIAYGWTGHLSSQPFWVPFGIHERAASWAPKSEVCVAGFLCPWRGGSIVLPTGLVTHAGKLVASPVFLEKPENLFGETNKPLLRSALRKLASYFLPLHFAPAKMETGASLENIVKIYLKVSYLSQSAGSLLSPGGVGGGWREEHAVLLLPGAVSRALAHTQPPLLPFLNKDATMA